MPQAWIRPSCIVLLFAAFAIDVATPQLFVVAILFNGPIALSSLALDSRFTRILIGAAIVLNAVAGYLNGVHDAYTWAPIAIGDRTIAALSFFLVGGLSIATQSQAARAGELAARQERTARERMVRRGIETVRASMNPELIERAIVREALPSLGAESAILYLFKPSLDEPMAYRRSTDSDDVSVTNDRPDASTLTFLHRMSEDGDGVVVVRETDPLGRLLLDTLGAPFAIAAPLVEHAKRYGVLVLTRTDGPFGAYAEEGLAAYADQAAIALAQASLFVQLAERNDDLAAANVRLRERGDVIRDIVYALSHDLRTPLAAARLTMHQALAGAYGDLPAAYREILERTIESNDELQRLAETLLLVSRYESGEASTSRDRVDLGALASDVARELEPLWAAKPVAVRVLAGEPVVTVGDEREIRRAIVNLVANAIAWTPPGRHVDVRAGMRDGVAFVAVEDDGYGVPDDERPQLFERVRATASRRGAGSGLGLYLVRRIAENHGGSVSFAPRAGGGSIFTLALPAAANAASVSAVAAQDRVRS